MNQRLAKFFSSPRNALRVAAVGLLLAGTYGTLIRQREAPADKTYDVSVTFVKPGGKSNPSGQVAAGKQIKVEVDDNGSKSTASFVLTPEGADRVKLDGSVECANSPAVRPALVARLGQETTVHAGPGCELSVLVVEATTPTR